MSKDTMAVHRQLEQWKLRECDAGSLSIEAIQATNRVLLGLKACAMNSRPAPALVRGLAVDVADLERAMSRS